MVTITIITISLRNILSTLFILFTEEINFVIYKVNDVRNWLLFAITPIKSGCSFLIFDMPSYTLQSFNLAIWQNKKLVSPCNLDISEYILFDVAIKIIYNYHTMP